MGDEDDDLFIDTAGRKGLNAMAKLLDMNTKINMDMSDYYIPGIPQTLEESLCKNHPAVKDAWEKYQTILKLAKSEHYVKTQEENNGR